MPTLSHNSAAVVLLGLLCGCASTERVGTLEEKVRKLADRQSALDGELTVQREMYEAQIRKIWSRVECRKEQVSEFLVECQNGGTQSCTPTALASAMAFMEGHQYVLLHLYTDATVTGLHSVRFGQLQKLVELKHIRPSTRYLLVVQPASDSSKHQKDADRIGINIISILRNNLKLPGFVEILGPYMLPCKLKNEEMKHYMGYFDRPQVGEPPTSIPHVRVWAFKTDC